MSFMFRRSWRAWAQFGLLLGIFFALQLRLWQAEGLFSAYRLYKKVMAQTELLTEHEVRNQQLAAQLKWLHHSKEAVEHHARQSLGMIKPNETFYFLVEKD